MNILALSSSLDSFVPISRFNKGEANKILKEVNSSGIKTVIKNNKPACIIMSIDSFNKIAEMIDDKYLLSLALERDKEQQPNLHPSEDVYKSLNIPDDENGGISMEHGVDFE